MHSPSTEARRSGKKLRHQAKLARRRLQGALATIAPSLGAHEMDLNEKPTNELSTEALGAEPITTEEPIETAGETLDGEVIEISDAIEDNTGTEAPVMAEPNTEAPLQASSQVEHTEIKEPPENNG